MKPVLRKRNIFDVVSNSEQTPRMGRRSMFRMPPKLFQPSPPTSPPHRVLPVVQTGEELSTFRSAAHFVHSIPMRGTALVVSVCGECDTYICASVRQDLLSLVERLHDCPGNRPLSRP